MQEISVFKLRKIFSGKIKEKAEKIARKFQGVTSVVGVPAEYSLKVTGDFVRFKLMKKLSKLDKNIDIIKIERVEIAPPRNVQGGINNPPKKEEKVNPPQANGWNLPAVPQVVQPMLEQGRQKVAKQLFAGALRYIRKEEVKDPRNKMVKWNGRELQTIN